MLTLYVRSMWVNVGKMSEVAGCSSVSRVCSDKRICRKDNAEDSIVFEVRSRVLAGILSTINETLQLGGGVG